jgi:site-specific DNA-methyltransferase (adenine-specific)
MTVQILKGDCRDVLKGLADESVHCVVSSPPYWRQRDYGVSGQLGLEQTPEAYINDLTSIMREVRRVLRSEGTAWINIGDRWASGGNGGGGSFMADRGDAWAHAKNSKGWRSPPSGYKDKDLVGLPFMLAFAMRADGWFWRQCNIWAKPNCMPESVTDRSTSSHEYVLHFSKRNDYWYDSAAARTPAAPSTETRLAQDIDGQEGSHRANGGGKTNGTMKAVGGLTGSPHGRHALGDNLPKAERRSNKQRGHSRRHVGFNDRWDAMDKSGQVADGANLRSVWWISPAQYREGHYAVMPETLAEICITAGCPKGGVVLDPFSGAGTTGLVADRLGRSAVLIELNPAYADMAERRISGDGGMFANVEVIHGI